MSIAFSSSNGHAKNGSKSYLAALAFAAEQARRDQQQAEVKEASIKADTITLDEPAHAAGNTIWDQIGNAIGAAVSVVVDAVKTVGGWIAGGAKALWRWPFRVAAAVRRFVVGAGRIIRGIVVGFVRVLGWALYYVIKALFALSAGVICACVAFIAAIRLVWNHERIDFSAVSV